VLYRGTNILHSSLNLRIILVKIENTGDVDILQSAYDTRLPWGFDVEGGQVVDVRTVSGTAQYIRQALSPRAVNGHCVELEKVVFDREASAIIQVLTLHAKTTQPTIKPFGKIAGLRTFNTAKATPSAAATWWYEAFDGGPITQVSRFIGYGLCFIVAFVIIGVVFAEISESRDNRVRKQRKMRLWPVLISIAPADNVKHVLEDAYLERGAKGLRKLSALLRDESRLGKALTARQRRVAAAQIDKPRRRSNDNVVDGAQSPHDRLLQELLATGVVRVESGRSAVDERFLQNIDDLVLALG